MRKTIILSGFIMLSLLIMLTTSCQDDNLLNDSVASGQTRAVTPYVFDWENVDWMPTPSIPTQSRIPSPWVGQGSLISTYGLDVINDRKAADGWELMYNSFDPTSPGPLVNPYFVIYNKYRGLMRFFLYTTTQFFTPSSYLEDGISVISSHNTSLLNYLGKVYIDVDEQVKSYSQLQPKPTDGSYPLASNRWYMMQYELAYDPNLENIPYNQIQLNWVLSSCNITDFEGVGGIEGEINGTIGSSSSDHSNITSKLGKELTTGVIAGVGATILNNSITDEKTGENKLNIPGYVFKALSKGINSAISTAAGNIPGAVINILSGIFGGNSSGPTPTVASFNIEAEVSLKGTATNSGSFPSMPMSLWTPGTNISSNAVGFVPLYNKTLGVVNFIKPINDTLSIYLDEGVPEINEDPWDGSLLECTVMYTRFGSAKDYSSYLIINPEVQKIATVTIKSQALYIVYNQNSDNEVMLNPKCIRWERWIPRTELYYNNPVEPTLIEHGVRFEIEVKPKDGSPSSLIYKTFKIRSY